MKSLFDRMSKAEQMEVFHTLLAYLTIPEDEIRELEEMDRLRGEIKKAFARPNEISMDAVTRFNELVRKHFPPEADEA